jgi:hypothetical protein
MRTNKAIWILLVQAAAALTGSTCLGGSGDDCQFWINGDVAADFAKNWTFTFEEQLRIGDDLGILVRHHSDFGVVYHGLAPRLS